MSVSECKRHKDELVQERLNSSVLAMELHLSCPIPSIRLPIMEFCKISQSLKGVAVGLDFSDCSKIWLMAQQLCCWATCQIWKEYEHFIAHYTRFEAVRSYNKTFYDLETMPVCFALLCPISMSSAMHVCSADIVPTSHTWNIEKISFDMLFISYHDTYNNASAILEHYCR